MAAYFEEGSEAMLALEAMVDKVGMANVLYALGHVSRMKAVHLRCAWQDRETARAWERDGGKCERLARTFAQEDVTTG